MVQLYHLGDVLLATPALRALRRGLPGARLEALSGDAGADVLEGGSAVDEVVPWRKGVGAHLALTRELRDRGYDGVVDFNSKPRTAALVAATGAPVRLGIRGRGPRNAAYTALVDRGAGPAYMARRKLWMLRRLGLEPDLDDLALDVPVTGEDRVWAREEWGRLGLGGADPVVALAPVARHDHKQWGEERWARAADGIARAGARVLLVHGPGERGRAARVVGRMREPAAWDHREATVPRMAALLARCRLWAGNDGGGKHIAVAAGLPTVSVVRHPLGPMWNDPRPAAGQAFVSGPPDGDGRRGLGAVRPERVVAAVLERLDGAPG